MTEPLKPENIGTAKKAIFPPKVIETWNKMIAKTFDGGTAHIGQNDIVNELMMAMNCSRSTVFDEKWLFVEEIYRAEGWKVWYESPDYTESFDPYFEFSKK